MFENQNLITLIIFVICYSVVGLFVYIMLKYLSNSAESLRIMHEAANRDFLTGFYNSRAFEVILEQKIASSDQKNGGEHNFHLEGRNEAARYGIYRLFDLS